jgi:cation:H+ antiporter
MTALLLLASFVLIVAGALFFTNAVEWLGQRLNLGEGAAGALLAAVGTALPESLIPVVALVSGGGPAAEEIAIGSIIGAPFLLGTLAMLLIAVAAVAYRGRRETGSRLAIDPVTAQRDLRVFLVCFPVAILLGLGTPLWLRVAGAVALISGYLAYAVRTARQDEGAGSADELAPLRFDRTPEDPPTTFAVVGQLVVSLGAIVLGAELFVSEVEAVATSLGVTTLVLSLVLAPLATELPEKINSVIWVRAGKDELALGNVTGAMTFQATLPVSIGLVLTSWDLESAAVLASVLAVAGGALAYVMVGRRHFGAAACVVWGGLFCAFLVFAALG